MMATQQSNITSTSTVTSTQRTYDTTKKYHFNWHDNIKCQSHCNLQTAPVLSDAVQRCVDTAAEVIATHREARLTFLQGPSQENAEGKHTGNFQIPLQLGYQLHRSGIDGATTRGIYPSFVIHPNYHIWTNSLPSISNFPTSNYFSYYN